MRITISAILAVMALESACLLSSKAEAQPSRQAITVSATKEQLTLTMRVPGQAYAQGAAVPITLRLHNSSSGVRVLWVWGCHNPPYGAQVLDRSHRVVYPVATPGHGGLPCTGNMAPALFPGKSITYHLKVILNGPLLRARIPFGVPQSSGDTREILSTRAVVVGNF